MKKALCPFVFILLFVSFSSSAANYFWVGGTGSWTDLTHWATTSGGSTKHTTLPSSADDVFFDANSFTSTGQIVTITDGATCRSMNWTGVTNNPTIYAFVGDFLNVHGSFILPATVTRNFMGYIRFRANTTGNNIDFGGLPLRTPINEQISFEGAGGAWTFQSAISVDRITLTAGTLNTNNQAVTCSWFISSGTTTRAINLGSSVATINHWDVQNATGFTVTPGTSTIVSSFRFTGKGLTYNNLTVDGTTEVYDNNTFNTITVNEGVTLELKEGTTQTITNLVSNGTASNPITITSVTPGSTATLSKSSGSVTINHARIQDNVATGGATFTANNSVDLGNVIGWNIPIVEPTVQASSVIISNVQATTLQISWSKGNGARRFVLARAVSAVNGDPADNTAYTPNVLFGSGSVINTNNYVVYAGTGNSATIIGLTPNTTYHFRVYEFNGSGATANFLTTAAPTASATTLTAPSEPTTATSNITATNVTANSMTVTWTNGNGANRVVVVRANNPVNFSPLDNNAYTANNSFGSGTAFNTNNYVVYNGAGNSVNITNLAPFTTYYFSVVEYNGSGSITNYRSSGATSLRTTLAAEPTTATSNVITTSSGTNSLSLSFTPGNGTSRLIVLRPTGASEFIPVDGTSYTSFTTVSGNMVVINNSGTTQFVNNLAEATTYQIKIYEFASNSTTVNYLTSSFGSTTGTTLAPNITSAAINFIFTDRTFTSFRLSWTNGNGTGRIVIVAPSNPGNPVDGTTYAASSVFGSTPFGPDGHVVYDGTGSSVTVTGLTPGTTYQVRVHEYNGSGPTINYGGSISGLVSTIRYKPTVPASNLSASAITASTATLSWTRGNGSSILILAREGAPVPVDQLRDSTRITQSTFGYGFSSLLSGNLVYAGAGQTSVNITNLSPGRKYYLTAVEYNDVVINGTAYTFFLTANAPVLEISTLPGKNYYWVNGKGDWKDFAAHWATTSGGSTFHTTPPTRSDNAIFDENSFTSKNDSVYFTEGTVDVQSIDWSKVKKQVYFGISKKVSLCNINLRIFGSVALSDSVRYNVGWIDFLSPSPGNTVDMAGKENFGTGCNPSISFEGGGEWTLKGQLRLPSGAIEFTRGKLIAVNTNINASTIAGPWFTSTNVIMHLDVTNTRVTATNFNTAGGMSIIGGDFRIRGAWQPEDTYFRKVTLEGSVGSISEVKGGSTTDSLIVEPGKQVIFEKGTTHRLGKLIIKGDSSRVTALRTNERGAAVTFTKSSGSIDVDYVFLEDNQAEGGAIFQANNSVNMGNVTGWNFINPEKVLTPTLSAYGLNFEKAFTTTFTLRWKRGNGIGRIVVVKEGSPMTRFPSNGTTYTASNLFASGSDVGDKTYVVYNGNGESVSVDGLTPGKKYFISIYEYNTWNNNTKYRVELPGSTTITMLNTTDLLMSNESATVCNVNFYDGGGKGLYQRQVTTITKTVYPATAGAKLNAVFSYIRLAGNDSIIVRDGVSASSPIIAKLTRSSVAVPPIAATNPDGALTFVLKQSFLWSADDYFGWQAQLFCVETPAALPTQQASELRVTARTGNSMTLQFKKGNGTGRVLLAAQGAFATPSLPNGYPPNSNPEFNESLYLDNYSMVYAGPEETATVTNLRPNVQYYFYLIEYNGGPGTFSYLNSNVPTTASWSPGTIKVKSFSPEVCPNTTLEVPFEVLSVMDADNRYLLEMSDVSGSFANPVPLKDTAISHRDFLLLKSTIKGIIPNDITGGNYRIRVRSTAPEIISDSIRTIQIADVPDVTITKTGSVLTSSSPTDNQWFVNGKAIAGETSPTYTINSGGSFTVRVKQGDCFKFSEPVVIVSTEKEIEAGAVHLYPNPVSDNLVIELNTGDGGAYIINDIMGRLVIEGILTKGRNSVNVSRFSPGQYLVTIKQSSKAITRRFSKK